MALKKWFRGGGSNREVAAQGPNGGAEELWTKCSRCQQLVYNKELESNLRVCPKCGYHFRLSAWERVSITVDEGSFREMDAGVTSADPLAFPDYQEKLRRDRERLGLREAILTGEATLAGHPLILGVMDLNFRGGSMSCGVGEKVARAMERAIERRWPLVIFCASGGARMQEGLLSLMQMAKTSVVASRLHQAGVPYVTVFTDPTLAGVSASFAWLSDVILAEPGAEIGFTGKRVIEQNLRLKLPEENQTAEFQQRHGMIDWVVPRSQIRGVLARLLSLLTNRPGAAGEVHPDPWPEPALGPPVRSGRAGLLPFEKPLQELEQKIAEKQAESAAEGIDHAAEIRALQQQLADRRAAVFANLSVWDKVLLSRHQERPYTLDYLSWMGTDFLELHGDRRFGDDPAMVAGLARFNGQTVGVVGQQKGRSLEERQRRNFGRPGPEGYRKALRLMHLAEKLHFPVICFLDTQGAACLTEAEERGISEALARCQLEMAQLRTPILVAIIGEGMSGGAIALGVGDYILMLEHAIYSVILPEACASILWRDEQRAREAAEALQFTAQDALRFGLIDEVVEEPLGGAHTDPAEMARRLQLALTRALQALRKFSLEELIERRYARFRAMGPIVEERVGEPMPEAGLEPARGDTSLDFESSVSTNSTTPAG